MRCELTLFDTNGERKYLCASELPRFLKAARRADAATSLLCSLLVHTGCRLSEALAVTPAQLDAETGRVVFRTLKQRARVFRAVPIPPDLMAALRRAAGDSPRDAPIWRWSRQTAWRRVKRVMEAAGIAGAHATPKRLAPRLRCRQRRGKRVDGDDAKMARPRPAGDDGYLPAGGRPRGTRLRQKALAQMERARADGASAQSPAHRDFCPASAAPRRQRSGPTTHRSWAGMTCPPRVPW